MSDIDPAALEAALAQADAGTRKLIQTVYGGEMAAPWVPEPTNQPQSDAYHSKADLLLYGGAAGGGKSDLLLGLKPHGASPLGDLPPHLCGPERHGAAADRDPRHALRLQLGRHGAAGRRAA